ncbi:hypothetical protein LSAT2_029262 [Lamellibrachia satsuma]|nr:hypothetical protein LSAT2_029262 [Lamellibrachia satsuma]
MTARRHGDTKAGAVIRRVLGDTKLATPAPRWRQEIAPDVRLLTAGRRRGRGLPARMGAKIGGVKGRLGQSSFSLPASTNHVDKGYGLVEYGTKPVAWFHL